MKWASEWHTVAMQARVIPPRAIWMMRMPVLTHAYLPLIGASGLAVYATLCSSGSEPLSLHTLAARCGIVGDDALERWATQASYIEALGLMRSYVRGDVGRFTCTFVMREPLSAHSFFSEEETVSLLTERIGVQAAEAVRALLQDGDTDDNDDAYGTDVSHTRQEVFHVGKKLPSWRTKEQTMAVVFRPEDVLRRFPRSSVHRRFVERMLVSPTLTAQVNEVAGTYALTLKETVSLLDEQGMFRSGGEFVVEHFHARAAALKGVAPRLVIPATHARTSEAQQAPISSEQPLRVDGMQADIVHGGQTRFDDGWFAMCTREVEAMHWLDVPEAFGELWDARQYNAIVANASYAEMLRLYYHPSHVPQTIKESFHHIHINYQLPDEVINALIHYIRANDLDWSPKLIDAIAANIAGKHIRSFEQAVAYFRAAERSRKTKKPRNPTAPRVQEVAPRSKPARQRPPAPSIENVPSSARQATPEDIQRIRDKAKRMRDR
ncbi:MAG: DnaD domain protein [Paenibacillaceae bacterium]|nr:DnaD domain protein [Paenibacillaceae bacterium]